MLLLVVHAHRAAHGDDRRDPVEPRQRLALVELDAHQGRSALPEHVLVDAGRLAADVLEDEDLPNGVGHQSDTGSCRLGPADSSASSSSSAARRIAIRSTTGALASGSTTLVRSAPRRSPHRASPLGLARLLHRVQDDPDQDVDHDERGDHHEADEVHPRPRVHGHPCVHVDREVLEREHDEERQHRPADVPPLLGELVAEQRPAHHPVDEEEHSGREPDREERRNAPPDARQQHAEVGEQADDPDDACQAREAQERRGLPDARDEGDRDDDEVEDVPAVAEEVPRPSPVGPDAEAELDDEHDEAEVVDESELVAVTLVDARVGLETEHRRVRDDHDEDRRREPVRLDDAGETVGDAHRDGAGLPENAYVPATCGSRYAAEGLPAGVKIPSTASSRVGVGVLDDVHLARAEPERDAGRERLRRRRRCGAGPPRGGSRRSRRRGGSATAPSPAGCSRRTSSPASTRCAGRGAPGTTALRSPGPARRGRARRPARSRPSARAGRCRRRASMRTQSRPSAPATSAAGSRRPARGPRRRRETGSSPSEPQPVVDEEERVVRVVGQVQGRPPARAGARRARAASSRSGGTSVPPLDAAARFGLRFRRDARRDASEGA